MILWALVSITFGMLAREYLSGQRPRWRHKDVCFMWTAALGTLAAAAWTTY